MDDFKTVKANAWSLPPGETRGELIFVEHTKFGTFKYYHDKTDGTYWYQSESTERFHKEMREKEKERKQCSRRLRDGLKEDLHQDSA